MRISYSEDAQQGWVFVEGGQQDFAALSRRVIDRMPDSGDPYTRFLGRLAERVARPSNLGSGRHQVILGIGQTAALIHTLRQDEDAPMFVEGMDTTADQIVASLAEAVPEEFSSLDDVVAHVRRMVSQPVNTSEE